MTTGFFFDLDLNLSRIDQGIAVYRYKRVRLKNDPERYPVFVVFDKTNLSFYSSTDSNEYGINENTLILSLYYTDHQNQNGKLSDKLKRLRVENPHISSSQYELPKSKFVEAYKNTFFSSTINKRVKNSCAAKESSIHKEESETSIPLYDVLLDLLFDLKYTELFESSPHINQFYTVTRENYLLNAIIRKADFLHRARELQSLEKNPISQLYYERAQKQWLNILLDEKSADILGDSGWFPGGMEAELDTLLQKQRPSPPEEWEKSQKEKVVEWLVNRFNFGKALGLGIHNIDSPLGYGYSLRFILLFILYIFSPLFFYISSRSSIALGVISTIFLLLGLVIIFSLLGLDRFLKLDNEKLKNIFTQKSSNRLAILLLLLNPKLLLGLLSSWIGYNLFADNIVLNDLWVIVLSFVCFQILQFFVRREIKSRAPDLDLEKQRNRSNRVTVYVFILSLVIGTVFMDLSFEKNNEASDFYKKTLLAGDLVFEKSLFKQIFAELDTTEQLPVILRLGKQHEEMLLSPMGKINKDQLDKLGIGEFNWDGKKPQKFMELLGPLPKPQSIMSHDANHMCQLSHPVSTIPYMLSLGNFQLFPFLLLQINTFVLFTTFFLNFLFKGESFTGWYRRK